MMKHLVFLLLTGLVLFSVNACDILSPETKTPDKATGDGPGPLEIAGTWNYSGGSWEITGSTMAHSSDTTMWGPGYTAEYEVVKYDNYNWNTDDDLSFNDRGHAVLKCVNHSAAWGAGQEGRYLVWRWKDLDTDCNSFDYQEGYISSGSQENCTTAEGARTEMKFGNGFTDDPAWYTTLNEN